MLKYQFGSDVNAPPLAKNTSGVRLVAGTRQCPPGGASASDVADGVCVDGVCACD
jgi:hypothetical protein